MRIPVSLSLAGAVFAATASLASAQVNFDFSTAPSPAFTTVGTWNLDTTAGTYSRSYTTSNTASIASISQTAFGGSTNQDFSLSTTFTSTIGAADGISNTIGVGLLGSDSAFVNPFYLVDLSKGNTFRITRTGSGSGTFDTDGQVSQTVSAYSAGPDTGTFTINVTGSYSGGQLSITASLFEGATELASISGIDTSPLIGTHFGFRTRTASPGNVNVAFDNFALAAIPEPSTFAAFAGLGVLGFAAARRRGRSA